MSLAKSLKRKWARWTGAAPRSGAAARPFVAVPGQEGILRRDYRDYAEYLEHQASKLGAKLEGIRKSDAAYEDILLERLRPLEDFKGRTVLCLGARLGGEVRALKRLGALAIGVDLAPGDRNLHVLPGDFHSLQFPDAVFDFAFTNALDHAFDLARTGAEAARVLKPGGRFLVEVARVNPSKFEAIDTSDPERIVEALGPGFERLSSLEIANKTEFIDWRGVLFTLRRTG